MPALNPSLTSTSTLSNSQAIFNQFLQVVQYPHHQNLIQELNQCFLENPSYLPRLLNNVIYQLKQQKIPVSQARNITATACHLVAEYIKNYTYKAEEEAEFKQLMSLLNALIYGAIKTPLPEITPEIEQIASSSTDVSETKNLDKNAYGLIALMGVNSFLEKAEINNDFLVNFSIFYGLEWSKITEKSKKVATDFLRSQNFVGTTPEELEFIPLLEKYGWQQILGAAEFQYRKNQFINQKSRLNELGESEQSPFEFIQAKLSIFQQKLKDSISSMMILEEAKLDFSSDVNSYLNCLNQPCLPQDKLLIVFKALTKMYIEGLSQNYQVRQHIEQGIQFSTKAQELYKAIFSQWSQKLGELTRLTVTAKVITTPNGHKMKKTVLDWPLSNFFPDQQSKKGKITQTVLKEKVDLLSLSDCADLIILLYCNIQETANPLGQVNNLYSAFREKMTLTPQDSQFMQNYLEERGFSPHQISQILESQEDV